MAAVSKANCEVVVADFIGLSIRSFKLFLLADVILLPAMALQSYDLGLARYVKLFPLSSTDLVKSIDMSFVVVAATTFLFRPLYLLILLFLLIWDVSKMSLSFV